MKVPYFEAGVGVTRREPAEPDALALRVPPGAICGGRSGLEWT